MAKPDTGPSGVLLLDKPAGVTSTRALARAKRLLGSRKAGHAGTLDPFATGLLPLAFGEATRYTRFLLDARKGYRATVHLGQSSTTGDPEGVISGQIQVHDSYERIGDVVASFAGVIEQVPPMHSAVHHEGRRLYELAREGVEVARPSRTVEIFAIDLLRKDAEKIVIDVICSKGTYIRVLAEDIGKKLGCGAYLTELRRTRAGPFEISDALSFEALEKPGISPVALLLPPEILVQGLPRVDLGAEATARLVQGQPVAVPEGAEGECALFDPAGRFLGVGVGRGGLLAPLRLGPVREPADAPDFA